MSTTDSTNVTQAAGANIMRKMTLTDLPQEILDNIGRHILSGTLEVEVYEYRDRSQSTTEDGCVIKPLGDWRRAVGLRHLHSKLRAAVDEGMKKTNTVAVKVWHNPNPRQGFPTKNMVPLATSLSSEAWDEMIAKHTTSTIIITDVCERTDAFNPKRKTRLILELSHGRWEIKTAEHKFISRDLKVVDAQRLYVFAEMRAAIRLLITGQSIQKDPMAAMLSELQGAMTTPSLTILRRGGSLNRLLPRPEQRDLRFPTRTHFEELMYLMKSEEEANEYTELRQDEEVTMRLVYRTENNRRGGSVIEDD